MSYRRHDDGSLELLPQRGRKVLAQLRPGRLLTEADLRVGLNRSGSSSVLTIGVELRGMGMRIVFRPVSGLFAEVAP